MHDVAIVGSGIAGSAAAALYGRRGLDVLLLERATDPAAYKTVCTTFIQSSATPVFERLGLVPQLEAAGAQRNRIDMWTRWGWIHPPGPGRRSSRSPYGYNLRRQTLDPMLRELAASTPGVEVRQGLSATGLLRDDGRVSGVLARTRDDGRVTGVLARTRDDRTHELPARLVVGADGRASKVAEAAGLEAKARPNARIATRPSTEACGGGRATTRRCGCSSPTWSTCSRTTTT